jgi:hypothetical protein
MLRCIIKHVEFMQPPTSNLKPGLYNVNVPTVGCYYRLHELTTHYRTYISGCTNRLYIDCIMKTVIQPVIQPIVQNDWTNRLYDVNAPSQSPADFCLPSFVARELGSVSTRAFVSTSSAVAVSAAGKTCGAAATAGNEAIGYDETYKMKRAENDVRNRLIVEVDRSAGRRILSGLPFFNSLREVIGATSHVIRARARKRDLVKDRGSKSGSWSPVRALTNA